MITKPTIDRIMEATDIVEVIGEFVQLKKRGANYVGLSPFANERTPSFTVSPAKGIFKDFSSGKGGSAVTFLMELEKFTYPEALKWLAKKYSIEVEETVDTTENNEENQHLESLRIVSAYAANFFHESLLETDEGKSIGLSYFKERGFSNEIIKKFELGYSPDQWEAFSNQAIKDGYQADFLIETGLSVRRDNGTLYDRYRGRIIFPIHSATGKIVGFGGRTLLKDKNVPKYVNSPESLIYNKSNILYGFYFAQKAIRAKDKCYLVEGYADVLSVFQSGIENVVASSGTSLTEQQVRLIKKQTKNLTILYDGDSAGIKAAIRGFSLLYVDEFNVRIVTFPENHDPDSYVRAVGSTAFENYIEKSSKGMVDFYLTTIEQADLKDPVKKIKVADDLAEILSNNPEPEFRSFYTKQVAEKLKIDERNFIVSVNKLSQSKLKKASEQRRPFITEEPITESAVENSIPEKSALTEEEYTLLYPSQSQEKEIVRLLLVYGNQMVNWDENANTYIGDFVVNSVSDVEFDNPVCKEIIEIYKKEYNNGVIPDDTFLINHEDSKISDLAISMLLSKYELSPNWEIMHNIKTNAETKDMRKTVLDGIYNLKRQKIIKMLDDVLREMQTTEDAYELTILQTKHMQLKKVQKVIADYLGTVIVR